MTAKHGNSEATRASLASLSPFPAAWGLLAESTRQDDVYLARFCFAEALTFRQATHSLQSELGTNERRQEAPPPA
ncbi:hypothetical protein KTAU_28490 [Thermogemmatispora aurantia]|nr:hypothetical protein KTAU_28490 [Thermogemmatispora aurantia]